MYLSKVKKKIFVSLYPVTALSVRMMPKLAFQIYDLDVFQNLVEVHNGWLLILEVWLAFSSKVLCALYHFEVVKKYASFIYSACITLLLHRLPKLLNQCYLNGPGNLDSLGSNKEIQPRFEDVSTGYEKKLNKIKGPGFTFSSLGRFISWLILKAGYGRVCNLVTTITWVQNVNL